MTKEFQKAEWKDLFDSLSRDLFDWETTVHLLHPDTGAQILSEKLPFNGLTLDEHGGKRTIELLVGAGAEGHQTHNIVEPTKVAWAKRGRGPAGTLDIEGADGTTTLITFMHPRRFLVDYVSTDIVAIQ